MGNNCCRRRKRINKKIVLLLVGLDNAGKTVTAKNLAREIMEDISIPTVGFSIVQLKYLDYNVKIYDLGGGANIRGIWNRYFTDAHGVIYVIDSSDIDRLPEVKNVFTDVIKHEKISGKPVLILANKNDQENALDEIDIIEFLNIENIVNECQCPTLVQSCSATESNKYALDEGISKGYVWLMQYIIRNFDSLNERVENDTFEVRARERQEMMEKLHRIRELHEKEAEQEKEDAIESYSDYARKLNGNAPQDLGIEAKSISDSSSDTFPHVYFNQSILQHSHSAVQVIKHQLRMNESTKTPTKHRRNKTAPIHLFGVNEKTRIQSAKERRKKMTVPTERNLRSADERIFTISGRNAMGPSGDFHRELFQLKDSVNMPSVKKNTDSVHNTHGDCNDIQVVEVD